jgi:hypothetical protein
VRKRHCAPSHQALPATRGDLFVCAMLVPVMIIQRQWWSATTVVNPCKFCYACGQYCMHFLKIPMTHMCDKFLCIGYKDTLHYARSAGFVD